MIGNGRPCSRLQVYCYSTDFNSRSMAHWPAPTRMALTTQSVRTEPRRNREASAGLAFPTLTAQPISNRRRPSPFLVPGTLERRPTHPSRGIKGRWGGGEHSTPVCSRIPTEGLRLVFAVDSRRATPFKARTLDV